jgi:hypothetical protein
MFAVSVQVLVVTPEPFVATPIVNNPSAVLAGVPKAKLFSLFGWPAIAAVASAAVGSATTNDAELNPIACEELKGVVPSPAEAIALPDPVAVADDVPIALVTREVPLADALAPAFPVVLSVVVADASPGMPAAAPLNACPLTPPVAVLEPESELPVAVPSMIADHADRSGEIHTATRPGVFSCNSRSRLRRQQKGQPVVSSDWVSLQMSASIHIACEFCGLTVENRPTQ